jgi:cobalt-zinc-cadmium efflux system protein
LAKERDAAGKERPGVEGVYSCAHDHGPCEPVGTGHDHSHGHSHSHGHKVKERKLLVLAIVITGAVMFLEFLGGWWSNSLALMSDAGHMLTHLLALGLSYGAIVISSRESSAAFSFGYFRSETLAALFNAFFLLVISGLILWEAYEKFLEPGTILVREMFLVAVVGLVTNIATAGILMRANPEGDLNIKGAFIHLLTDTFSSVGVVVGAVVIHYTGLVMVDPILSVFITVLILVWVYQLARSAIRVLLESAPEGIKVEDVKRSLLREVPEVKDVHDIHIWEITSNMYNMTAHVVLDNMELHEAMPILARVKEVVRKDFNIGHASLQLECMCFGDAG